MTHGSVHVHVHKHGAEYTRMYANVSDLKGQQNKYLNKMKT